MAVHITRSEPRGQSEPACCHRCVVVIEIFSTCNHNKISSSAALVLLLLIFHFLQLSHFVITRSTIDDILTLNQRLRSARIATLLHFSFAVMVSAADVEAMDVRGDDGETKQEAVDEEVGADACEVVDCNGWEEEVYEDESEAFDH